MGADTLSMFGKVMITFEWKLHICHELKFDVRDKSDDYTFVDWSKKIKVIITMETKLISTNISKILLEIGWCVDYGVYKKLHYGILNPKNKSGDRYGIHTTNDYVRGRTWRNRYRDGSLLKRLAETMHMAVWAV